MSQDAFGFLVSSSENSPLLDVVFNSCSFPQGERTILTAMMGGRWFESLFGRNVTEETLLDVALKEVRSVLGIEDTPSRFRVHILRQW